MMNWIYTGIIGIALVCAILTGQGQALAASVPQGAQAGVTLALSMAGSICLWSGVGKLMEKAGFTGFLSRLFRPILNKLFPSSQRDAGLSSSLSANICANFLGLGNAATPMGIRAAQKLAVGCNGIANDELCRLVVLNTASIQLIPATVAALRTSLGCQTPFDILPAVWITSFCSAGIGLLAAGAMGRLHRK